MKNKGINVFVNFCELQSNNKEKELRFVNQKLRKGDDGS